MKLSAWVVFAVLAAVLASPASARAQGKQQPAPPAQPQPAQIDRNGVIILVRSALLALDHANKTGNYTVLRDLGAPAFQTNTAARLAEIFANHRRDNVDLSGVSAIDPQLTLLPQIEANGFMRMAGVFPSVPTQVNFELMYAPVSGQWRLFALSVNLGSSTPTPPAPPPEPAPTPPPAKGAAPSSSAKTPPPPPRQIAPAPK